MNEFQHASAKRTDISRLSTLLLSILVPVVLVPQLLAQGEARRTVSTGIEAKAWDRFHDLQGLLGIMQSMQKRWPKKVKIESIGKSHQGRDIWCMTVHDPSTGHADEKPAMYIDGNIHGNEIQGAEAALYTAWYALKYAPSVKKLDDLLKRVTLYILPSVNPDGRAYWFSNANNAHSSRGGQQPTDNDGDGIADEDGPDDLDGDGNLCRMRKKVPGKGRYKLDPDDSRLLIRVKPGEVGDWDMLGSEGIDNDGDGRINEDGPGGYDPNRDWGSDWQPSWIQYGARPYPFQLPESRAVRDFILKHQNIAGVQAFHNNGGMILRGPGDKNVDYARGDLQVYDEIGKKGETMLPFYRYMIIWKDLYTVHGGFVDWTYIGQGIISFTNELWTSKRLNQSNTRMNRKARREWDDLQNFGSHFVPWKEFDHPTYGKIEIGGPTKNTGRIPPNFLIPEMLHRNATFVLYQAGTLPELVKGPAKVTPIADDLSYVTITIKNKYLTPTRTRQAAKKKIGVPDLLHALGDGVEILSAGQAQDDYRMTHVTLLKEGILPTRIPLEAGIGPRGQLRMRYLVRGKGKITFRYEAEKAKDLIFTVEI